MAAFAGSIFLDKVLALGDISSGFVPGDKKKKT
jgi:hypothetical protein